IGREIGRSDTEVETMALQDGRTVWYIDLVPKVSAEHMAATRRRVLDGARRAFAAYGYEGATVKLLEQETGLSRGAIFHHFPDKDALFLALASEDAEEVATLVDEAGLVEVMRRLRDKDAGWLGVQLEVTRRLRTDAD